MTTRDYWYEGDRLWLRGGDQPDRNAELQLMVDAGWILLTTTTYPDHSKTWHVLDAWIHPDLDADEPSVDAVDQLRQRNPER